MRPDERRRADAAVLVVDDELANVRLAERILMRNGFRSVQAITDPKGFGRAFARQRPDLVLLDLHMPEVSGLDLLREIPRLRGADEYVPVLILTGDTDPAIRKEALSAGAIDFITKPFDETEIILRVDNYLEVRRLHLQLVDRANELDELVHERTAQLEAEQDEAFSRLHLVSEFRDDETHEHTVRVGLSAGLLAHALGLPTEMARQIRKAAPLHDIGKIGIPDAILLKPRALLPEESELMRTHCELGARIIGETSSDELALARVIAETHHEHWDGSGYPKRLRRDEIPLAGRVVAVCDVFDALIHRRPYKPPWSIEQALEEVRLEGGTVLDPELSRVFADHVALTLPWVASRANRAA